MMRLFCLFLCFWSKLAAASISPTEEAFLAQPTAESARANLRYITSTPHIAGTPGDYLMAKFVKESFLQAGIPDVSIFNLDVLLNYPVSAPQVSLLRTNRTDDTTSVIFQASLSEDLLDDASDTIWRNHTFHGYGASGNVTAPLVYANYGRPDDFAALEKAGVSVRGTIVLVRYGACFRGLKVMNAQERGAVGVLIYSDPADDGFRIGDVYPDGPWRPASGVQRGSSKCAGDPVRADARYANDVTVESLCNYSRTDLIPQIPSLPLSYGDAKPLLETMGGLSARKVGGDDFVGGLDIEYTVGPSSKTVVHLVVDNKEELGTVPNVVGYIPGSLPPEEDMPVLLGNHRDAWVYGAADPNSGTAALLEVARGLGTLLQSGWTPRRSIYLLSWSGEEYGLLGSTGWAELNRHRIARAAAYLNVDTVVSGDVLQVSATPALATLWEQVLHDLNQSSWTSTPFANGPVGEIRDFNTGWKLNHPPATGSKDTKDKIGTLGSGSDYTAFLDHLGIASLDFSFGKRTSYGQYHSIYDSFAWMDAYGGRVGEEGSAFELMAFSAKIWGLLALRLADSKTLPFNHIVQGKALSLYTDTIEEKSAALDLEALKKSVEGYEEAAITLHLVCANNLLDENTCNEKLGLTERQFLASEGLPNRPWFKHVLQAPGMYLGYAAEAFPGIQQALEMGNLDLAREQVLLVTERIDAAATFLRFNGDMVA